jgi:hypothetical protein
MEGLPSPGSPSRHRPPLSADSNNPTTRSRTDTTATTTSTSTATAASTDDVSVSSDRDHYSSPTPSDNPSPIALTPAETIPGVLKFPYPDSRTQYDGYNFVFGTDTAHDTLHVLPEEPVTRSVKYLRPSQVDIQIDQLPPFDAPYYFVGFYWEEAGITRAVSLHSMSTLCDVPRYARAVTDRFVDVESESRGCMANSVQPTDVLC